MLATFFLIALTDLPPWMVGVDAYLSPSSSHYYSTSDIVVIHPKSTRYIRVIGESGYEDSLWTNNCEWTVFYLHEETRRATVEVTIYEIKTPAFEVIGQVHGHHSISEWYVLYRFPEIVWYRVGCSMEVGE